jgi:hypothetical protein
MNKAKGKQATRGLKQIIEENEVTRNFYTKFYVTANIVYVLVRYLLFWDSFELKYMVVYSLTSFVQLMALLYMIHISQPVYSDDSANKKIIDYNMDLNMAGGGNMCEYLKDLILLPAFVYLLSLYSNYAWFLLLAIPVYVVVKLWNTVLAPWIFAPAPDQSMDNNESKKVKEKRKIIRVK